MSNEVTESSQKNLITVVNGSLVNQTIITDGSAVTSDLPKPVFKENDRVRSTRRSGTLGTVDLVRVETNTSRAEGRKKDYKYLIRVKWDSGVLSYFSPESLELVV
jgi:hypothetical protein